MNGHKVWRNFRELRTGSLANTRGPGPPQGCPGPGLVREDPRVRPLKEGLVVQRGRVLSVASNLAASRPDSVKSG